MSKTIATRPACRSCMTVAVIVTAASLGMLIFASPCGAADVDSIWHTMKGNDARLNNVLIDYTSTIRGEKKASKAPMVFELRIDPDVDRNGMPSKRELTDMHISYAKRLAATADGTLPPDDNKWIRLLQEGKIKYVEKKPAAPSGEADDGRTIKDRLALRWPNFALARTHGNGVTTKLVVKEKESTFFFPAGKREWFLNESVLPSFPNVYHETPLTVQWALGVGYSPMIPSVVSVVRKPDGKAFSVTAKLDYWGSMSGEGEFTVDKDGVVRHATIVLRNQQVKNHRIEVETSGEYVDEVRPFRCASKGRVIQRRGQHVFSDDEIALTKIAFDMKDSQYAAVADCSSPETDALYRVTDDGVELLRTPSSN